MAEITQDETRAPLERDVQQYLAKHLSSALQETLTLVSVEHPVPFGRIDILAQDGRGSLVPIELKLGVASREAVGQLQSYMGALQDKNPKRFVRGILVALSLDAGAEAALRVARDIQFISYAVTYSFTRGLRTSSTYDEWKSRMGLAAAPLSQTVPAKSKLWLPPSYTA